MEKQIVTLSIPKDILQKARIIAIEQNKSLSGLLIEALTDIVVQSDQYQVAKERHLNWMEEAADLGTQGNITWSRQELHDR